MTSMPSVRHSSQHFLIFTTDANSSLEVRYEDGTIWLTQKALAELFDVDVRTINEHLLNIYDSGELQLDRTVRNFRIVRSEGTREVTRSIKHYDLDAIISVGYRVNSIRATQFRQWATKVLRDFTLRGFVIDRERMESGEILGVDYFEQLLQQIREIRLSERRLYQKITDIYSTAVDYSSDSPTTRRFFSTIQNKLHFAVHGQTAAELIKARADATKPHMGLTSWHNAPQGKILPADVTVGKNYLTREELDELGRIVEAYLNLAESRAKRHLTTTMEQWATLLDQVLTLDSREILDHAGKLTKKAADQHALAQYETFREQQDHNYVSDYDRFADEAVKALEQRHP